MNTQTPTPLNLNGKDGDFLVKVAQRVLGSSTVAATNATKLREDGFDVQRIEALIPWESVPVEWQGFVFKKVEADPEAPANFGLFVRRREEPPK